MSFGDTKALQRCSFRALPGEIHAIVGENGSGKSTLAKIISGVMRPQDGRVEVLGGQPGSPRRAAALGLAIVFQEILLADNATVMDNVFLGHDGLVRKAASGSDRVQRTAELMGRLTEIDVDPYAVVADLPLSTKQWIVIARALIRRPRVLILDESTAALDLPGAARLHKEVRALRDQSATVLLVTHRIAELTSFADRATVLRDGTDVGVLTGAGITEEALLELMSGEPVTEAAPLVGTGLAHPHRGTDAEIVVSAATATLAPATLPFSFTARRGEVVGLAGLEGHGQSEFAKVLAGFLPLAGGEVRLPRDGDEGTPIRGPRDAANAGLSYVSGDRKRDGIFPNLSIIENFGAPLYRRYARGGWIDFPAVRQRFREQVSALSIKVGSPGLHIGSLSGGHQQKVLIGRALAADPTVIVLNDPARGVDIRTKKELHQQLRRLADAGRCIIYVSSELEEFPGFCDRVGVFRNGVLADWVTAQDIEPDRIMRMMFGYRESAPLSEVLEATP